MKKNISKKIITYAIVGGIFLSSVTAFADQSLLIMPRNENIENIEKALPEGSALINKDMYEIKGETKLVPLRKVIEGVGLNVEWNTDTETAIVKYINLELEISLDGTYKSEGLDLSNYDKAILKEERFYVPANLLQDVLNIRMNEVGDDLVFQRPQIEKECTGYGTIEEIIDGTDSKLVTFLNNYNMQKITLVVSKETKIINPIDNTDIKVEDLKVGDMIYAEHSNVMTRSIPPQTAALKIEVVNDYAVSYGIVEKVEDNIIINIGSRGGVHLNLIDNSVIEDEDGNKLTVEDIKVGDNIRIYHSQVLLPVEPLTYPTIKIVK